MSVNVNKIIVLRGKHVTRYFKADSLLEKHQAAFKIFEDHHSMGYYNYPEQDKLFADELSKVNFETMTHKQGSDLWNFINRRHLHSHEYEDFYIETLE